MSICAQSSQRATWPPRAAVRQLSIADGLERDLRHGLRHGLGHGLERDLRHGLRHGLGRIFFGHQRRQAIERACHRAEGFSGDACIERRRLQLRMTERPRAIMSTFLCH